MVLYNGARNYAGEMYALAKSWGAGVAGLAGMGYTGAKLITAFNTARKIGMVAHLGRQLIPLV